MSRRDVESLDSKIKSYNDTKKLADIYKKEADKYNKEIKEDLLTKGLDSYQSNNLKVTLTTTPKSKFNDLQAIEILRSNLSPELFSQVVKTKEYIDNDVLETLIYNHTFDAALLSPCVTEEPPVYTLRIKTVKSKED